VASLRNQREASEAELKLWRHHKKVAEADLDRYRQLEKSGTVTPQRLDEAENTAKEAAGRVAALVAQIASFEARITAAQRERDLVALKIRKTRVGAPISATVLVKTAEVGEFLQPGSPVAVLVDLSRITLKIYLPEAEIGKVKLSAPARVRVDAFPQRLFDARVDRVDQQAQFTPRDIHMPEERVRLVFGVTLSLENPDGILKPGMPADAWILWQEDASWPEHLIVPR
jgi:HlyD family secretion protein